MVVPIPNPEEPPPSEDEATDDDEPNDGATTEQVPSPASAKEECSVGIERSDSDDSLDCWNSKNPPTAMVSSFVTEKYTKIKLLPKVKLPKSKTSNATATDKNSPGLSLASPATSGKTTTNADQFTSPGMEQTRSLLPVPSKKRLKSTSKAKSKAMKCKREKAINISGGREKSAKKAKPTKVKTTVKSQGVTGLNETPKVACKEVPGQSKTVAKSNVAQEDTKPLTNDEMEELNDELNDLNTSMATLRFSHENVNRSLTNINNRRGENAQTLALVSTPGDVSVRPKKTGDSSSEPTLTRAVDICGRASTNYEQKYSLDRFVDGRLRANAFAELFAETKQINSAMAHFRAFFNSEGYFRQEAYQKTNEQLSRAQYGQCLKVIKDLSKVVATILKAYNEDRLDAYFKARPCTMK